MKESSVTPTAQYIEELISKGHITDAISSLRALPANMPSRQADRLREVETIYSSMLRFFKTGAQDPSREELLSDIKESLYEINDSMERLRIFATAQGKYFSQARIDALNSRDTISGLIEQLISLAKKIEPILELEEYPADFQNEFDITLNKLFNKVWVNTSLTESDSSSLQELIQQSRNMTLLAHAAANVMSAVTLSALEYYDPLKLELLLKTYSAGSQPMLEARALVGIEMIMQRHPTRISGKNIKNLSLAASERENFRKDIDILVKAMLRTRDTDRVNKKMQTEIIPELLKLRPEIEKRIMGIDPASLSEDDHEFMELIDKSGINAKLREITDMQMQGADIFMGAFASMKKFPFFSEVSNWFLPFNINHSSVHSALSSLPEGLAEMMLSAPVFCASDKYSLALAMSRMPKAQSSMMASQMQSQFEALSQEQRESLSKSLESNLETELNVYLKDLFRFFRISDLREELYDPFRKPLLLPDTTFFASIKDDIELQRLMADFYFKYGYFRQALHYYKIISESIESEASDLKKLGYSYEKTGDASLALEAYRQAELMDEPDRWLLKRMAAMLRATGRYAEAAETYARVLKLSPDDIRIELLYAHTMLEAGNIKEALKSYYKVDYINPEESKAIRGIAWCEFLLKNYDKSLERYEKIIDSQNVKIGDYMNYGHVLFASSRIADAINQYRKVVELTSPLVATDMLAEDIPTLKKAGISDIAINLMRESIINEF